MLPVVLTNQIQLVLGLLAMWYFDCMNRALPLPSAPSFVAHLLGCYAIYEIIFYSSHRILHIPSLYAYHALHHVTKGSVGVSGMYQGHLDYFLTTTVALSMGPIVLGSHVTVMWLFALVGGFNSIHSHGGYCFPFMPSPREHDLHHANSRVNFGTGPLDWLLGTAMDVDSSDSIESKKA